MAGNKALQKFKDSKIPKKGKGKIIIEVPIYKEPNTQSEIIGRIKKDCEINWISKSICDEREWIRTDENNNFGYIVGYEKDGKCNLEVESIKEKKDEKKKDNNYKIKIKPNEIIPLSIEEINYGEEALKEILNDDDDKKDDNKSNSGEHISTGPGEYIGDFGNKSDLSSIEDDKVKVPDIKIDEENWDDFFEDDISKIDFGKYEHDKLLSEILCKFEEEKNNNQPKNDEGKKPDNNGNNDTSINKETEENSISKAISSIIDIVPGNEQLSYKDNIVQGTLDLLPGGKKEKKGRKGGQRDNNDQKKKKDKEEEEGYVEIDGKIYPKNYARDGANFNQALKDAKRLNKIPKNLLPIEFENKDKRGKRQDGSQLAYFLNGTDDKLDDEAKRDIIEKIQKGEKNDNVYVFRNDASGHKFEDDYTLPPHINDPKGRHFYYEPKSAEKGKK